MRCSIKSINLPDAPAPTRARYKKPVACYDHKHIRVVELPGNYPKPLPEPPKPKEKLVKKAKREAKPRKKTPPKIWTPDKVERLTELYSQGVPYNEIAEKLGVKYGQVCGAIDRLHEKGELIFKQKQGKWTQREVNRLLDLKASGLTWHEISEKMGRPIPSCSNKYLKEVKK